MINRLRSWTRAFFGISTREANGLLILLPLLLAGVFIIPVYHHWQSQQPVDFTDNQRKLDSLLAYWPEQKDSVIFLKESVRFAFDPNTATSAQLDSLGFPPYLTQRIQNYRNKNGKFKIKTDLLKMYGMDTLFYSQLEPFILLPDQLVNTHNKIQKEKIVTTTELKSESFDINLADSAQLIKIYGIGSKLSARIITYRNKLGGFISLTQLREVPGLDSAVIGQLEKKYFVNPNFQPRKISLNHANEQELNNHPYIKYNLAKAIATYRFQHGNFNTLEEVKKIALVDETFYSKILPYLSLNP
ncbi:MAG TPA: helix-hairpin-helix domain-containing protein [Cyclobacteriaceae bacterium]|jgi:competence protein ComEA|nr:helix-hairpin-helix domain-containing protein [Cytophagales bacterium]HMR55941.1 helix-hairpin-helix domain-containing protein [Cyclobacteriaceae bacterium]HNT50163.1 helix-hairpin-helix domain-containing protein [Cyclobacteriaceae bacterium]HRE66605.1 helix-hairpin-helix domain-containing protein [Cyclobacteriaceae bacterium]HRF35059.1 helix-hairpin-helix domain-containing protein [Cyclobacteriaceae bacterium]